MPFLAFFYAVGCSLLVSSTAIYVVDHAVNSGSRLVTLSAARGDHVTSADRRGEAYFDDAECRLPAAAEVAYLQIPSRNSFTETLAVEDLQLLAPKEGWRWAAAVS